MKGLFRVNPAKHGVQKKQEGKGRGATMGALPAKKKKKKKNGIGVGALRGLGLCRNRGARLWQGSKSKAQRTHSKKKNPARNPRGHCRGTPRRRFLSPGPNLIWVRFFFRGASGDHISRARQRGTWAEMVRKKIGVSFCRAPGSFKRKKGRTCIFKLHWLEGNVEKKTAILDKKTA